MTPHRVEFGRKFHNITSWNKAAEKIYGYKDTEIVGKPISLLTTATPSRWDSTIAGENKERGTRRTL